MRHEARQRGVALIAVLWVGFLLTVVAASLVRDIRVQTQTAHNLLQTAKAEALAEAGIVLAAERLRQKVRDRSFRAAGTRWSFALPGGRTDVVVQDEGGKIDLNRAPKALLDGLFRANGAEDDLAAAITDAIADWRDRDNVRRLNGAEDSDYRRVGLRHGAKDGPFERIDEARRVLGMTVELYRKIAPALTIYSGRRGIDLAVAPREALRALSGVSDEEITSAIENLDETEGASVRVRRLSRLITGRQMISSSNRRAYSIRATARTDSGALFSRDAVIRMVRHRNRHFDILMWKRGSRAGTGEMPIR